MKRRPLSEVEISRQRRLCRLPSRFGPKPFRPRSLWFFEVHRTRWRAPSWTLARGIRRAMRFNKVVWPAGFKVIELPEWTSVRPADMVFDLSASNWKID
jgi:hypothetical protein